MFKARIPQMHVHVNETRCNNGITRIENLGLGIFSGIDRLRDLDDDAVFNADVALSIEILRRIDDAAARDNQGHRFARIPLTR